MKGLAILAGALFLMAFGATEALAKEPPPAPGAKCSLVPQRGPCKAMFEKYYYNANAKKCTPFFWGGCEGVVPFDTLEECESACVQQETLNIRELRPINDIYAEVSLEFPKAWEHPEFQVQVDGRDLNARSASGGYSGDRGMASLLFFPGKPGVKQIGVVATAGGKTVRAVSSLDWKGRPFAALLGYAGDRSLVMAPEKIRLIAANIENSAITFNGEPTRAEAFGQDAILLSIDPPWRPGLNTISFDGKGADGSPVKKTYTFVYYKGGIRQGESMLLRVGTVETKSGPFYSVAVEGDALTVGSERMVDSLVLDREGWIGRETVLVRELKAAKPGQARVLISEKPHFLQERELQGGNKHNRSAGREIG